MQHDHMNTKIGSMIIWNKNMQHDHMNFHVLLPFLMLNFLFHVWKSIYMSGWKQHTFFLIPKLIIQKFECTLVGILKLHMLWQKFIYIMQKLMKCQFNIQPNAWLWFTAAIKTRTCTYTTRQLKYTQHFQFL